MPDLADSARKKCVLTAREREVLSWVARGKSASEIAIILNIAKRTVDEHAQSSFRKLGASNRTHAVAIALRDHLIEYAARPDDRALTMTRAAAGNTGKNPYAKIAPQQSQ